MPESVKSAYFDASALIKLARPEAESEVLRALANNVEIYSSEIARIELRRAAHRNAPGSAESMRAATGIADATGLIPMDRMILDLAGDLTHPDLGSLDAIHVSTALNVAPLDFFVTYDIEQARAAAAMGLNVVTPRGTRSGNSS